MNAKNNQEAHKSQAVWAAMMTAIAATFCEGYSLFVNPSNLNIGKFSFYSSIETSSYWLNTLTAPLITFALIILACCLSEYLIDLYRNNKNGAKRLSTQRLIELGRKYLPIASLVACGIVGWSAFSTIAMALHFNLVLSCLAAALGEALAITATEKLWRNQIIKKSSESATKQTKLGQIFCVSFVSSLLPALIYYHFDWLGLYNVAGLAMVLGALFTITLTINVAIQNPCTEKLAQQFSRSCERMLHSLNDRYIHPTQTKHYRGTPEDKGIEMQPLNATLKS